MWISQVTYQDPRAQIYTGQPQHCAVDWQFDGDNILYLVRISYDGCEQLPRCYRITFN